MIVFASVVLGGCTRSTADHAGGEIITATIAPGAAPMTIGLPNPKLQVLLHNHLSVSIVLRGVSWMGYPPDPRHWLRAIYGSTSPQPDGSIIHNLMAQQLSQLRFESGLILPGGERSIETPLTPQCGSEQLIVRYSTVGEPGGWKSAVLLPDPAGHDPLYDTYRPIAPNHTPTQSEAANALVTSTMKADAHALPIVEVKLTVGVATVPASARLTGGLSASDAARKAGLSPAAGLRFAYIDELKSWFVVARSGEAVALRRVNGRWVRIPMPAMDPIVPERFGKVTYMLLNPNSFGDLINVRGPSIHMYYDAGGNGIAEPQLWTVLKRARDRRIRLKLVSFDPNGLGVNSAICAGVTISTGGQWIDPPLKPTVRN